MMNKPIIIVILSLFILGSAWASIPQLISLQGKLTNSTTGAALNGNYQMNFSIYNVETNGDPLWYENQTVAVSIGTYNVYLGSYTALTLPFNDSYWLETKIYNGSGWETLTPRQRLTSSPYSFSGGGWMDYSSKITSITPTEPVGIGTSFPNETLDVFGSISAKGPIKSDGLQINDIIYGSIPSDLWIGDDIGYIYSINPSKQILNHGATSGSINSMSIFEGRLWLAEGDGILFSCDNGGTCSYYGAIGTSLKASAVYDNKLWLGDNSTGNLYSCDSSGTCTNHGSKADGINFIAVFNGKLWLGAQSGNVYACDSSGICTDYGDKGNAITSMAVFNGQLWLGKNNGDLDSCNSSGSCTNHGNNANTILTMVTFNNNLWIGNGRDLSMCNTAGSCTDHGAKGYRYCQNKGCSLYTDYNLSAMAVYNGYLWIGDQAGNLYECYTDGTCYFVKALDIGGTSSMIIFSPSSFGNTIYINQGLVGIGTTTPTNVLSVIGNASITGPTTLGSTLTTTGTIYTTGDDYFTTGYWYKSISLPTSGTLFWPAYVNSAWAIGITGDDVFRIFHSTASDTSAPAVFDFIIAPNASDLGGPAAVGIGLIDGVSVPLALLHVNGSAIINGTLDVDQINNLKAVTTIADGAAGNFSTTENSSYGIYVECANDSTNCVRFGVTGGALWTFNSTGYYLITGTKSGIFNTSRGLLETYYAVESPTVELTVSGSGQLKEGIAKVEFDYPFNESLSDKVPVRVLITPTEKCSGLYVEEKSMNGFTVKIYGDCPNDATFDWLAIGRRIAYGPGEHGDTNSNITIVK